MGVYTYKRFLWLAESSTAKAGEISSALYSRSGIHTEKQQISVRCTALLSIFKRLPD